MREIKFRMVYQTTGEIIGYTDAYRLLRYGDDELPDYEKAILHGVSFEQYTGLTDKNGKEVYEGDIIKYDGLSYAVKWSERYASFETVDLRDGFIGSPSLHFIAGLGSVIGNIHENLGGEDVGV